MQRSVHENQTEMQEVIPWRYASIKRCGFCLRPVLGTGEIGWVCILAAFPFALGGFFTYNGMTLERFLMAYIRSEFLMPKRLLFRTEDLYVKLMEHTSIKEAIRLD